MNSLWPVLQTYLWRPRFWVLALLYFGLVWGLIPYNFHQDLSYRHAQFVAQGIVSSVFACTAGCFFALHLRRQFTTDLAQTVPDYAAPHLVIAGAVVGWICVILPGLCILAGLWPWGILALHVAAAIFMALIVVVPKGLVLLLAIPVIAVWSDRVRPRDQQPLILELAEGNRLVLAALILVTAAAAVVAAVYHLLRLPRMGVSTNDELTVDHTAVANDTNPINRWVLEQRDAAASRLMQARHLIRVQRWRVPLAISPAQLAFPGLILLCATCVGWSTGNAIEWAIVTTAITCAVLLLVPIGPLQSRRRAMGTELMRPVTREQYFRQVVAATGWDFAAWLSVGTTLIVLVAAVDFVLRYLPGDFWHRHASGMYEINRYCLIASVSTALFWSLAVFVFGLGAALLRLPFWLPIVATLTMVWFFGGLIGLTHVLRALDAVWAGGPRSDSTVILLFTSLTACIGCALLYYSYRRWLRLDVV